MTTVHQLIPVLAPHDAVGGHTRRVQAALRAEGHRSDIFAEVVVGPAPEGVHHLSDFERAAGPVDLLLYQASTGADSADWLRGRSEPYAVDYHNVTPASFFDQWAPEAAANMRRGRSQLRALAPRSVAGLADSTFNASELEAMGYQEVGVAPLLLDLGGQPPPPDPQTAAFLERTRRGAHWLFVGRLAPNKCQHDLLAALAVHRRLHDPGARLTLVGSPASTAYRDALLQLADQLGVEDAVTMVSGVPEEVLSAYYEDADVFVCLSEHEGFCIPLLEAMRHSTPVVALAATAVPETAGAAAVLLPEKEPHLVATVVDKLLRDAELRRQLVSAGHARVEAHSLARCTPVLVERVERALGLAGGRGG